MKKNMHLTNWKTKFAVCKKNQSELAPKNESLMEVTSSAQTLLAPRPTFPLCYLEKKIREMVRRRPFFSRKRGPAIFRISEQRLMTLVSLSAPPPPESSRKRELLSLPLSTGGDLHSLGGRRRRVTSSSKAARFPPKKYYGLNDLFYCLWAASAFAGTGRSRRGRN